VALAGKTILLIEDDIDFATFVKNTLAEQNAQVIHINHPNKVLGALQKAVPDLILLDLNFHYQNDQGELASDRGEIVLRLRQGHPALKDIPLIVCSSENLGGTVVGVEAIGANDFLAKPTSSKVLLHKILSFLQ